jgi:hypothetical protein
VARARARVSACLKQELEPESRKRRNELSEKNPLNNDESNEKDPSDMKRHPKYQQISELLKEMQELVTVADNISFEEAESQCALDEIPLIKLLELVVDEVWCGSSRSGSNQISDGAHNVNNRAIAWQERNFKLKDE